MSPKEIERELTTFCNRMSEHVDSIRIMVTFPEKCMTACHTHGEGNWYAQRASVEEWLRRDEQIDLASRIYEAASQGGNE